MRVPESIKQEILFGNNIPQLQHYKSQDLHADENMSLREQVRQTGAEIDRHILTLLSSSSCSSSIDGSLSDHDDDDDDMSDDDSALDLLDLQRELEQASLEELPMLKKGVYDDRSCNTNTDKQLNQSIFTSDTSFSSDSESSNQEIDHNKEHESRKEESGTAYNRAPQSGVPTEVLLYMHASASAIETDCKPLQISRRQSFFSRYKLLVVVATFFLAVAIVAVVFVSGTISKQGINASSASVSVFGMDTSAASLGPKVETLVNGPLPPSTPLAPKRKRFKRNSRMLVVDRKYKAS
ncbi:hypothetical protein ACA910_013912 [Epithemia clementina (nom. ined.)]